ncbi:MAG: hypothetical protein KBS52_02490 [Clostridiales bacterium]|nr:hypothetical protein [Candidatus Equinaster intestinalis]
MRDDICTIPVSEVFEENDGCPICRMKKTVEEHIVSYIMGAAMMEPDVRIETNKEGFCANHYSLMLAHRGRLALALMLESHLSEVEKEIFAGKFMNTPAKKAQKAAKLNESCIICNKINWGMERMTATIYRCFENEKDFRDLFEKQTFFCMPHYEMLMTSPDKKILKKYSGEFDKTLSEIMANYVKTLSNDVSNYCKMYNYQNSAENCDWANSKDSVEISVNL